MGEEMVAVDEDPGPALLAVYDEALPHVYGYLLSRCGGHVAVAQDLTTQTFLAAVQAVRRDPGALPSRPWLMTVARNKLVDHWRGQAREERGLRTVAADQASFHDPWDSEIDHLRAQAVLARLSAHHRMVLTLRYLDDLPVPQVADLIGRTLHATEALLVRARSAFRRAYTAADDDGEATDA